MPEPEPAPEPESEPTPEHTPEPEPVTSPDAEDGGMRIYTAVRPRREKPVPAPEATQNDLMQEAQTMEQQPILNENTTMQPDLSAATAAGQLGLDATLPWSESLEPLRALFATRPAVATLEDDYVYVSAPLDGEEDGLRVGLRVENGVVTGLRYAVPALFTEAPPEGLEDWTWVGDDTHGWWVREGEV